ncbi:SPFH domain / Band 7 family protein [Candidatus Endolissoclinum faulkneri L2]|uniref:SPFH domain / Band 7 family protein n=1 Tax=Candidatus Endolissoclinum faulkneri L2 TaxID=1193729 RepID=K7YL78_9PROT|nr:SPFH domain-containing protein [Candidatus Endolissoclinum faulkneri]AFX98237.1 SPFH domain / Band 7 family protein [Candidatus Endolissoclinum faulkneri L2]
MNYMLNLLSGGEITIIFFAIVLIILVIKGIRTVPQGEQWTVERFGRYVYTLEPGLSLINPLFSRIGNKVNMMENVLDIPEQDVITQDNAPCRVDAIVFYQVIEARRAVYEVRHLKSALVNLALTNIRSVLGSTDLDIALSSRDEMNNHILKVMDAATDPWGTKITRVEIKDITPPKDLLDAMASQMKAERGKRAQILDAEGYRAAAIQRAEGKKQSDILNAEGELVAAQRQAEARERLARAEADATKFLAEAIGSTGNNAVKYFVAQKYIEALSDFAKSPNQKTIFIPMEMSSIIGSIGGIKELLNTVSAGAELSSPPPNIQQTPPKMSS